MPIDLNTLLSEVRCLGCGSMSESEMIVAGLLQRIAEAGGGGGGGAPGGPINAVQFQNPLGVFAGSADLTFNDATNTLGFGNLNLSNPASDFVISSPIQNGVFRLLPFGSDIYMDNSFNGAIILRPNTIETFRLTSGLNNTLLSLSNHSMTGANAAPALGIFGTWNSTGSPVAINVSIVDTASGAASKFLEFLGGAGGATSRFSVDKLGNVTISGLVTAGFGLIGGGTTQVGLSYYAGGVQMGSAGLVRWGSGDASTMDTAMERQAAGIIEVNDGTTGTFRDLEVRNIITNNAAAAFSTDTTLTNSAGASGGTLLNAPSAGNPSKWIGIDDNGTTRFIPTWT